MLIVTVQDAKHNEERHVNRYNDLLERTEKIRARIVELEEERGFYEERLEQEKDNTKKVAVSWWPARPPDVS